MKTGSPESKPLRALFDDDVAHMNEAVRVYWAVVASALALDGSCFELPSPLDLPDAVAPLWARVRDRLAHKRVLAVAEPLRRELRRRLPPLHASEPAPDATPSDDEEAPPGAPPGAQSAVVESSTFTRAADASPGDKQSAVVEQLIATRGPRPSVVESPPSSTFTRAADASPGGKQSSVVELPTFTRAADTSPGGKPAA